VIVLPYHQPIALAKALASVDVLSNGRLLVGVAGGWLREEFELLGVPFRERGARTDESLALMRQLWTEDRVTFRGRFFSVENAAFFPKPLQKPHPPIWVGGDSASALRRVARSGDGWLAVPRDLAHLEAGIATIRREAEKCGRDPQAIGVATSGGARSLNELTDLLPRLERLGVTIVNVPALFWAETVDGALELLGNFNRA
jgi:probable F420-dependent oxidoreductase